MLKNIRRNDSLRPRYQTIFNQAVVLLVSYFGSAVHDLFRQGVSLAIARVSDSPVLKEELRVSVSSLCDAPDNLNDFAADLLVQTKDISFQDMQSITRSFNTYLQVKIPWDATVNHIILGQACRHIIVHTGGLIDQKFLRQISGATPRKVKTDLNLGDRIQFHPDEVEVIAASMQTFVREISIKVSTIVGESI
jgi:hypothetical protein